MKSGTENRKKLIAAVVLTLAAVLLVARMVLVDSGPSASAPPPIDLKFFGFASKMGESKRVFLSKGGDVFLAAEGDIVDRRYKVLRIGPSVIEIQDVLNNRRQSIPMTQG